MISGTFSSDGSISTESPQGRWALSLVAAALSFNFVLCFVNTNVTAVSNVHVIGCEFVILTLTFLTAYSSASLAGFYFVIVLTLYLTFLAMMRGVVSLYGTDVKIVRDFLIPVAFFWLGKTVSLEDADRIVRWSAIVILGVGLFEFFFLDVFLKYFNVIGFYIARGTVADTESAHLAGGGLMVSGLRPESQGRELLPFWLLGGHRVSSMFLEPSSLGNYGIIVGLWAVLRSRMDGRFWWGLFLLGICCIVLADTRFAAIFLVLGILILFLPPNIGAMLAAAMPFLAILLLLVVVKPADMTANDAQGRLGYAAYVFSQFDILNWIGLAESREQTFDAGYGYLLSNIGIFGVLALWLCFMSLSGRTTYFYTFRNAVGAYLAILFLISQSQMTIKTAALLWLLLGAVSVFEEERQPGGLRAGEAFRSQGAFG